MKILVTGGAGFIGSNFIRYMFKKNSNDIVIYNLDKLTYAGNLDNLSDIEDKDNYNFTEGDICNSNLVQKIMKKGIDVVINFAAESHVDRSIECSGKFIKTNIKGTQVLLENCLKHGIKRFIQISTDEVYGSFKKENGFKEDDKLSPSNPYSASKAAADLLILSYYKTYNLPVNIIRSTNNYGPYQYPEKIMPLFITNALKTKKLPIYGDGNQIRDWIHVKDHCKAVDLVINKAESGQIYNVSCDNKIKNIELTKTILNILNKQETLIKYVKDRPGHDRGYYVSSKKIKDELNWKSEINFKEGLKETVTWYIDNKEWWKG